MKRTGKVLAILLALAMLLSVTAFAAWDVYGSNANHNSVVDSAPTTATTTALNSYIDLSNGGRGWDGVDNVPVMETSPCSTQESVLAAAAAIGALPSPLSFEKIPRLIPFCIAITIVIPVPPPKTA